MSDARRIPGRPGTLVPTEVAVDINPSVDAPSSVERPASPSNSVARHKEAQTGGTVVGTALTNSVAELEKKTELANKRKALADAERAAIEAERALQQASTPAEGVKAQREAAIADANAAKAESDAQKALADARKAQADAELAAFKARIGDVPTSGITGSTELKDKAGQIEAWLLASKAVGEAAERIRAQLTNLGDDKKSVFVFAASEFPSFDALLAFNAQSALMQKLLDQALEGLPELPGGGEEAVPLLGAAGLTLQAVNNLLSYFRTDFSVSGVEVTLEDSALVAAVTSKGIGKYKDTRVPAIFPAAALNGDSSVLTTLSALAERHGRVLSNAELQKKAAAMLTARAGKETNDALKKQMLNEAQQHQTAADKLTAASTGFLAFATKLTSPDAASAKPPLATLLREAAVQAVAKDNAVLLVKIHKAGGTIVTKKNLWSNFGGLPIYYTGATAVTFVLLNGTDATVVASGLVPVYGGYVRADQVKEIR